MFMRESIFSVELQKILYKVGQQSYTPVTSKEPEDSRKFGSTQNTIWDTEESVQKACFEPPAGLMPRSTPQNCCH